MKYALVKDAIVFDKKDLTESEVQEYARTCNLVCIDGLDPVPNIGWHMVGDALVDPDLVGNAGVVFLSKEGFSSRFTDYELMKLEEFMDVGAAPYKYYVRALDKRVTRTTYIDRSRQSVINGLGLLVTLGILTPSRRDVIMNSPAKAEEIYRGT